MSLLNSNLSTDSKPKSMSVKDWIIRKLAPKMMMNEKTIEAVVNHQFQGANEALSKHNSLEISGFGKWIFNEKKAIKTMAKYESQKALFEEMLQQEDLTEKKKQSLTLKLQTALDNIRDLKPKIYEHRTDLRGMEEQSISTQGDEGIDKDSGGGENGDMQKLPIEFG
jgi:nucleoid DNA-binding protein